MLNIFFGEMPDAIYDTPSYFNNTYLDCWLEDDFSITVIKEIDHAIVLSPQAVNSKALGVIPVTSLSGGVKTLLLIDHEPQKIFNASTCGDNCAKWIIEISKLRDITVCLEHAMKFPNDFDAICLDTNEEIHTLDDYKKNVLHGIWGA